MPLAALRDWVSAHSWWSAVLAHPWISLWVVATMLFVVSFGWLPMVQVASRKQILRLYVCSLLGLAITWPLWKIGQVAAHGYFGYSLLFMWITVLTANRNRAIRRLQRNLRQWAGLPVSLK